MKRIVREISDWRVVGNVITIANAKGYLKVKISKVDNDTIWTNEIKDEWCVCLNVDGSVKTMNMEDFKAIDAEQITFEQAFKTWFEHPIAFIHPEYGACFIDDSSEENINEWIHDIQGSTYKGKSIIGIFHDSKTLEEAMDKCQFYQSESWPQFFEFDYPTLIRMARDGVRHE